MAVVLTRGRSLSNSTTAVRVRACARATHDRRFAVGDGAYALFAGLILLLAILPTGVSTTRQTISAYALAPQGILLRLAFVCLAVGSLCAAYEFWRSLPGTWGRLLAGFVGIWVTGDLVDTVVSINPVGKRTTHGEIHAVVAVVAFAAVAATVLVFLAWLHRRAVRGRFVALAASLVALLAIAFELVVTLTSATFLAGTAERVFFAGALVWMITARRTVTHSLTTWPPGVDDGHPGPQLSGVLASTGAVLLGAVTILLLLLAVLPGHRPFLAVTISSSAYGPHAKLVFVVLLLFGTATALLATSTALRLRGAAGPVCGLLGGVWAVAAVFDTFVRTTSGSHAGTAFGQVHTMMAVAGIIAQLLAAIVFLAAVHHRTRHPGPTLTAVTTLVLAGIIFVAVHPDSLAGLSERLLLAASAVWMVTCARVAPSPDRTVRADAGS